jgi:hypothetical protein
MTVTDPAKANSAAFLMLGALAAHAGFTLLTMAISGLVMGALGPQAWLLASELVWLAIYGALAVALFQLGASLQDEDAAIVRFAGLAVAGTVVLNLLIFGVGETHLLPGTAMTGLYALNLAATVAMKGVLLFAFVKVAGKTQAWITPLAMLVAVLMVVRSGFTMASLFQFVSPEFRRSVVMTLVLPGLSAVHVLGLFAVGFGVKQAIGAAPQSEAVRAAAGLQPMAPVPVSPAADFVVGGILLAVGIGVSMVSYSSASGGGRYVVATGAIGVGIGRIIRGLIRLSKGSPAA